MRTRIVATGNKRSLGGRDRCQRPSSVLLAANFRGIGRRSHDDEIVRHHIEAPNAIALLDEALLAGLVMDQEDIRIPGLGDTNRLAGSHGHDANFFTGRFFEERQNGVVEPRVFRRRR